MNTINFFSSIKMQKHKKNVKEIDIYIFKTSIFQKYSNALISKVVSVKRYFKISVCT